MVLCPRGKFVMWELLFAGGDSTDELARRVSLRVNFNPLYQLQHRAAAAASPPSESLPSTAATPSPQTGDGGDANVPADPPVIRKASRLRRLSRALRMAGNRLSVRRLLPSTSPSRTEPTSESSSFPSARQRGSGSGGGSGIGGGQLSQTLSVYRRTTVGGGGGVPLANAGTRMSFRQGVVGPGSVGLSLPRGTAPTSSGQSSVGVVSGGLAVSHVNSSQVGSGYGGGGGANDGHAPSVSSAVRVGFRPRLHAEGGDAPTARRRTLRLTSSKSVSHLS